VKRIGRSIIALVLLLGWWGCAFGLNAALDIDQYAHTAWKSSEGFARGSIQSIAQTPDGYLWLGTNFGLLRFDGVRSVPWRPPKGTFIPDSHIRMLLGARDGTLWIGTWAGLASWKGNNLTRYPQLNGWFINGLLQDRQGNVWASAQALTNPFAKLCAISDVGVQCAGDDGRFGRWITSLHEDSRGNLWVQAQTGLWHWQPGAPRLQPLPVATHDSLQGIADGDSGALLIITQGGIAGLTDKATMSPVAALSAMRPSRLLRDRDGGLWVGTHENGLLHVHDGRTDKFQAFDGLSGGNIQRIFEDREGNIWVCTAAGLDRFRDVTVATYTSRQGLSSSSIASVFGSRDGSIWISTSGGLNHWKGGEITVYSDVLERSLDASTRTKRIKGLPRGDASLFEDHAGRLWLGARGGVGYLEDDRYVAVVAADPRTSIVAAITEDKTGDVWFTDTAYGLTRVSQKQDVQRYSWQALHLRSAVSSLAADPRSGGLWLGLSTGGIAQFLDGRILASYSAADGLANGRVNGLRANPNGALWVSAEGGLSRLKSGRISTLDSRSGLPCDSVGWMIEDDAGAAWIKTSCGLARIDRGDLESWETAVDRGSGRKIHATVIGDSEGFTGSDFGTSYNPEVAKDGDGRLWFYNVIGVGVVNPRALVHNRYPPPVHIEELIADRKIYKMLVPLRLPPLVRDLQIDYTALSLVAPEKVKFRYVLEGRDRDWQNVGARRQAFYSDLPPGNYRFHVIASNNSGVWNEQGDTLEFSITPAYWQTIWFKMICVVAFLGLLWTLYQVRLRQVARAFELGLEARVAERTRIARELHDTLLQSFQGVLLRFQTAVRLLPARPAEAKQVLESTMDQAEAAVADSRNAVQGLRSSVVESYDLSDAIKTVGEELGADRSRDRFIPLSLRVEGTVQKLKPIVRDEVYRIASEALRNAFRHSGATRIEVELQYDARHFELRIRDDGKGIDSKFLSEEGREKHFGLSGMRERAAMIGGKLTLWTSPNSGTELDLKVPGSRAYGASPRRRSWFFAPLSTVGHEREP